MHYFNDLLTEDSSGRQLAINTMIQHIPRVINSEKNIALMRPISTSEVEMVVMNMPKNKALGPDDLTRY